MKQPDESAALLPSGFADLLPPEAEREFKAIENLMNIFSSFGYSRVKPPLLEFEDSLFAFGPGALLSQDTFRLMDPLSHRMMGIRSDITTQIARIALSRLNDMPRPLRLTYANDVLRTKGSQQRTERQFCQVGCEIVGAEDPQKDIESCVIALLGLKTLGIKNITIDLAYPQIIAQILQDSKINKASHASLMQALAHRDESALNAVDHALGEILKSMLAATGPFQSSLTALKKIPLSQDAQNSILKIETIAKGVNDAILELGFDDITITIDPAETRGFDYKTGFGFTLFAKNISGALGRGGRYKIEFAGSTESATGFTLYMDTVARNLPSMEKKDSIYLAATESWAMARDLQKQGWIVIRGDQNERAACTYEYKNGQPIRMNE